MATIIVVPHKNAMWNAYTWLSSISLNLILKDYWKRGNGNWKIWCICLYCWLYTVKMWIGMVGRAGQGWSTGVQCVDWSCYDGHRPDPIRWYHQPPASQAPLPRTLQQLDQSPAAFGAEIMTHNLILENGLMSWHEMRPVQEQPGLATWQQLLL